MSTPWGFQDDLAKEHVGILNKYGVTFDANRTGRGKTHIACKTARLLLDAGVAKDVVVVSPKSILTKWRIALAQYGIEAKAIINREKLKTGRHPILSLAREKVRRSIRRVWNWHLNHDTFVIYDEIHKDAGSGSLNSEMLLALYERDDSLIMGLSATLASSPLKLLVLGKLLGLHKGGSYAWAWACENGCRKGFFGGLEWTKNEEEQKEVMQKIHHHIFPDRGLRLPDTYTFSDELPSYKFVEAIDFDAPCPLATQYLDRVEEKAEGDLRKAEEANKAVTGLVTDIRERQAAELCKCEWLLEQTQEILDEGGSVVLFVNYKLTIECLKEMAAVDRVNPPLIYHGDMGVEEKQASIEMFNTCRNQWIIVQIASGGSSIDLHDTRGDAERHTYLCPTYTSEDIIQALGRADRLGRKSPVYQTLVYASKGIEREIYTNVQKKINNLSTLLTSEVDPRFIFQKRAE
jgi:SNF2 family DNA or RNA helicase